MEDLEIRVVLKMNSKEFGYFTTVHPVDMEPAQVMFVVEELGEMVASMAMRELRAIDPRYVRGTPYEESGDGHPHA